jgi:hypothetical protein
MAWSSAAKKPEYKLSLEAGRQAVLELVNFYDIEFDGEPDKAFDKIMDELAGYYRRGLLENKKDDALGFCVVQHLVKGQDLTYREMKGKDRLAHSRYDGKSQADEKVDAVLGKLCGLGDDAIASLMGDDRRAAALVAALFFGV